MKLMDQGEHCPLYTANPVTVVDLDQEDQTQFGLFGKNIYFLIVLSSVSWNKSKNAFQDIKKKDILNLGEIYFKFKRNLSKNSKNTF